MQGPTSGPPNTTYVGREFFVICNDSPPDYPPSRLVPPRPWFPPSSPLIGCAVCVFESDPGGRAQSWQSGTSVSPASLPVIRLYELYLATH